MPCGTGFAAISPMTILAHHVPTMPLAFASHTLLISCVLCAMLIATARSKTEGRTQRVKLFKTLKFLTGDRSQRSSSQNPTVSVAYTKLGSRVEDQYACYPVDESRGTFLRCVPRSIQRCMGTLVEDAGRMPLYNLWAVTANIFHAAFSAAGMQLTLISFLFIKALDRI